MNTGIVRSTARRARLGGERARLQLWARRLDARLRRAGGRFVLDAPHGAHFHELPHAEILPYGDTSPGTLTLRLGRHAHLGRGLILEIWAAADNTVELGDEAAFRAGTRLQLRGGTIRLGHRTVIRDHGLLDVMHGAVILTGERVQFGSQCALHAAERIEIADHVAVGERTSIFDSDHSHDGSDVPVVDQPDLVTPVTIGRNTFVGLNSLLLRGAHIGPNAMLAAGTVMRAGEYPGGFLYAGTPVRSVRPLGPPPPG
jgi:acetyltransferase-like isoleucine patch superfamily enzyme